MFSEIKVGAKLAIVGEAPSEGDVRLGKLFSSSAGKELRVLLAQVGIDLDSCSLLNVFDAPPPRGNLENFMGKKVDCGKGYKLPPIKQGKYVLPQYTHNIERVRAELAASKCNLVLALGNVACWAVLGTAGVGKLRGTVTSSADGIKVIPTYSPSALLRQWELRPIILADLDKVSREMNFPEISPRTWELWIDPTLDDLETYFDSKLKHASHIAYDIETGGGQISCIGFAPDPTTALVVPFTDKRKANYSYWSTPEEERLAWNFVARCLELPSAKITQNGLYDMQWLWKKVGLTPKGELHDTMLMHHALYPELEKGLGFLGSVYTNTPAWKLMRNKANETSKADDE